MLCLAGGASAAPEAKGRRVLEPFDYRGVTLDEGPLRRQFDETRDYYLRLPNDDLLKGFRARAGHAAPGLDLGGWYTSDTFHVFGQMLSGLARMHAATGDPACRDKALALVDEWAKCIGPDGFFYWSAKPNAPHYIYDKVVGGLVDLHLYCGSREALQHLSRITDWAVAHLDRARPYGGDPNEWYTLSENLYRAYLATGDAKYRDFAKVWEYTDYWGCYARKADIFGPRPNGPAVGGYHAYRHVNTLGGAGAAYRATGEPRYLDVLKNAYDSLQANQCFATGGYGLDETLMPKAERAKRLFVTHNSFETQCGTWAAFKMGKYLIAFTGDARYGDWIERLVLNAIGASTPMTADGRVFYYADYNPQGATKHPIDISWSCCTGTRPMAIADYHDLIYFRDAGGLCVNLFTPSTVRWKQAGVAVAVRQRTRFPEVETVTLTVEAERPVAFSLRVRVPGWLAGPLRATVNGKPALPALATGLPGAPEAGRTRHRSGRSPVSRLRSSNWAAFTRTWRSGDRLALTFPMRFWASRLDPERPYPAAILRGPVVMAFRSPQAAWLSKLDEDRLDGAFVPSPGEALTYHLAADPQVLARPFYAVREGEPYMLYLDPSVRFHVSHSAVRFSPQWQSSIPLRYCNAVGAIAEHTFEGTGIRWLGYRFDDGGRGEVAIDGKVVAVVDQYGPGRALPFEWKYEGLPLGQHTIRITLLPEKSAESKERYLNVAGFEILHPDAPAGGE